jgi:hypothetical protein
MSQQRSEGTLDLKRERYISIDGMEERWSKKATWIIRDRWTKTLSKKRRKGG